MTHIWKRGNKMEFIILNLEEATEEQLLATINCNNRTARLMSSEIEKLKKVLAVKYR